MDFNVSNYTGANPNLTDSGPRVLGYSSGDYLWKSANNTDKPTLSNCSTINDECNKDGGDQACYQTKLCNNYLYSQQLDQQQLTHSGADGRYSDTKAGYNTRLLTTFNLSLGIINIGIFIYYYM